MNEQTNASAMAAIELAKLIAEAEQVSHTCDDVRAYGFNLVAECAQALRESCGSRP